MSNGINKVIIVGHLGADPDLKYMPSGDCVCNISVATSEKWRDKQTGEEVEKTEWHRVVMFRRVAEVAGEYLGKGSLVYIEGKLRTRKWQDKAGNDRYTTEIEARDMQMLGARSLDTGGAPSRSGQQEPQIPSPASVPFDDEIPF